MPKNNKKPEEKVNALETLHAKLTDLSDQATVIENTAAGEDRQLTPEEVKDIKALRTAFKEVEEEIDALEASAEMKAKIREPQERLTTPIDNAAADSDNEPVAPKRPYGSSVHGGLPSGTTKGSWGYRSFGDFAVTAVKHARGRPDARILNAPSTFGSEGQNADGGFAVPPDFRQDIMKQVTGEESLLSRCDQQISKSNALSLPLDTVSPWDTSNGVTVSWLGEGGTASGTKPKLGQLETKLNKLAALVPLTDELLEDVPAMTQWLQSKVPEKITSALNTAIINGSGVGQPMGILNAAAKVTLTAESGQGANTVVYKNIVKMWARRYARNSQRYLWLINQDVEQQLQTMAFPAASGSAVFPAYLPPGGLADNPYGRLLGRDVLPLEACSALGTEGDIILFDPTQYLTVMKSTGLKTDVSIHLYFDSDHVAFRFVLRFGGQLYWPAAISRQNGSSTLSPVVTLNSTRT